MGKNILQVQYCSLSRVQDDEIGSVDHLEPLRARQAIRDEHKLVPGPFPGNISFPGAVVPERRRVLVDGAPAVLHDPVRGRRARVATPAVHGDKVVVPGVLPGIPVARGGRAHLLGDLLAVPLGADLRAAVVVPVVGLGDAAKGLRLRRVEERAAEIEELPREADRPDHGPAHHDGPLEAPARERRRRGGDLGRLGEHALVAPVAHDPRAFLRVRVRDVDDLLCKLDGVQDRAPGEGLRTAPFFFLTMTM
jgi:hypothetical protein